jgi:two-component system response regulator FlrC
MPSLANGQDDRSFVFRSAVMENVLKLVERVAQSDASVLVLGESGTGKGALAEIIHRKGARSERAFVTVSCPNIPTELFESELFGHEKGAHTDAHARKSGKFEAAHLGTLLLDGLETLSQGVQAKLLRVLQDKKFERLGGIETVSVDFRVLSTGAENLPVMVAAGAFREDLYYRLNVVQIRIPPLRERPEDVIPLANHFLRTFRLRYSLGQRRFSTEARKLLKSHSWPGNVRELMNSVEAAVISAESEVIDPSLLPLGRAPAARLVAESAMNARSLAEVEEMYIKEVLRNTRGNKSRAAEILGINRKTLLMKLKKFDDETGEGFESGPGPDQR